MHKIIFISHTGGLTGGAELTLYSMVLKLSADGHTCHVVLPNEGLFAKRLSEQKIDFTVFDYGWTMKTKLNETDAQIVIRNSDSMISFVKCFEAEDPDLVVTNTLVIPWGMYVAKAMGIPNILYIHEWIWGENFSGTAPALDEYLQNINANADWVFCASTHTKNSYSKYISADKIAVLHPMLDLDMDKVRRIYRKNEIGDALSIIMAGSIELRKNQLELLRAVKIALTRGVKIEKVLIVGAALVPHYVNDIRDFIRENDLESIVVIEDFSDDLHEILVDYNIAIVPSLSEVFPRVPLESQIFGRLVIGSDIPGTTEEIENGKTGILYELGKPEALAEAIAWVSENPREAEAISVAAHNIQSEIYLSDNEFEPFHFAMEKLIAESRVADRLAVYDPVYSLTKSLLATKAQGAPFLQLKKMIYRMNDKKSKGKKI